MPFLTPRPGTDGNHSLRLRSTAAPHEDWGATFFYVS
jgi:hypothetical protein